MSEHCLEVFINNCLFTIFCYKIKQSLFYVFPMVIFCSPELLDELFVNSWFASYLWQTCSTLLLFYSCEEHVFENFRDFKYFCCHLFKFVLSYRFAWTCSLTKHFLNCLIMLSYCILRYGFALREVKRRHYDRSSLWLHILWLRYLYRSLCLSITSSRWSLRFTLRVVFMQLGVLISLQTILLSEFWASNWLWRSSRLLLLLIHSCESC